MSLFSDHNAGEDFDSEPASTKCLLIVSFLRAFSDEILSCYSEQVFNGSHAIGVNCGS